MNPLPIVESKETLQVLDSLGHMLVIFEVVDWRRGVTSHLRALPEPDVNLSIHPAPIAQPPSPSANARTSEAAEGESGGTTPRPCANAQSPHQEIMIEIVEKALDIEIQHPVVAPTPLAATASAWCADLQPFDENVVDGAAAPIHADADAVMVETARELGARELRPLIGIEDLRRAIFSAHSRAAR